MIERFRGLAPWLCAAAVMIGLASTLAQAQAPTTAPSAPSTAAAPPAPTNDPLGLTGGATSPLVSENYYLAGQPDGATDKDGNFKAYPGTEPTAKDAWRLALNTTYHLNFVWALVAGFLVMFMQAGFALVETGLCRGNTEGTIDPTEYGLTASHPPRT